MAKTWRYIESGKCEAGLNMSIDEAIASCVLRGDHPPTLRIYSWESPSVTIGSFQKLSDINADVCKKRCITFIRRPTGGRAILHCREITYSYVAENRAHNGFLTLFNSYKTLSETFLLAFEYMGIDVAVRQRSERGDVLSRNPNCFAAVSFGEIVAKGHKIIGSAQKRYKTGFLQQGSIPFHINKDLYGEIFQNHNVPSGLLEHYPDITMEHLKSSIKRAFEHIFQIRFENADLSKEESLLARNLLAWKYHSPEWTCRR